MIQVEPGYIQDTGLGGTCFAPIDDLNQHSGIVSLWLKDTER